MGVKVTNNAYGYLANSLTDIATLLTLQSGQGARFPAVSTTDAPPTWFYATLIDSSNNREIIKCTVHSASNDVFATIQRGQDGTTARAWDAGAAGGILVEMRPTAAAMGDKLDADQKDISGGVAGLTLLKIGFMNALGTFKSFFTNANTAARTYTFQDRDGTIADNTDLAGKANAGNVPVDTHAATIKATPVEADEFGYLDSATDFGLARTTWANIKATLDLLYQAELGYVPANKAGDTFTGALAAGAGLTVTGDIVASGNITAYSDETLKENWRPVALDFVTGLALVKSGVYDRTDVYLTQVGVSAQSLQDLMPEAIITNEDGLLSVAYGQAALAACIELAKEVVALRGEVEKMKP